jgi:hypothetical protein
LSRRRFQTFCGEKGASVSHRKLHELGISTVPLSLFLERLGTSAGTVRPAESVRSQGPIMNA